MAYSRPVDPLLDRWLADRRTTALILDGPLGAGRSTVLRRLRERTPGCLGLDLSRRQDRELVQGADGPENLIERAAGRDGTAGRAGLIVDAIDREPRLWAWLPELSRRLPVVVSGDAPGSAWAEAATADGARVGHGGPGAARGGAPSDALGERPSPTSGSRVAGQDPTGAHPAGEPAVGTAPATARVRLEPLSFLEFLEATGGVDVAAALREGFPEPAGIEAGLHARASRRFTEYLLVGGLPRAVEAWVATRDLRDVRRVQARMQRAALRAALAGARPKDQERARLLLTTVPEHLGSRVKRRQLLPGASDRAAMRVLERLAQARMLSWVAPTCGRRAPLAVRPGAAHRLLPWDIGQATAAWGLEAGALDQQPWSRVLGGRLARAVAGVLLRGVHPDRPQQLRLWVRESRARSGACVDHLVERPAGVVPVCVRAGAPGALKALHRFLDGADVDLGIRLGDGPGGLEDLDVALGDGRRLPYRLLSAPLYLAELLA